MGLQSQQQQQYSLGERIVLAAILAAEQHLKMEAQTTRTPRLKNDAANRFKKTDIGGADRYGRITDDPM